MESGLGQNPFERLAVLVGKDGVEKLHNAFVIVIGMGAVGSYAVEALTRAGVGNLRLIDFDEVRPSNINRQLFALHSTLGRQKVDIARERVLDINPACQVEALNAFFSQEAADELLAGNPNMIIDAIDSLNPKVDLLEAATRRGLPILSSMGAARRFEPDLIRFGVLSEVYNCPLARLVRRRLKNRKVELNIPCVYSIEKDNQGAIMPLPAPDSLDSNIFPRGRERRPMGSISTLTGMFGLMLAHEAIRRIVGK